VISRLSIQGLAIIDSLQIDFEPGFNVITGETGAGKSILIRALNFLTGAKASVEVIRSGWEAATVVGEFTLPPTHRAVPVLTGLGIAPVENGSSLSLLLRRQLTSKGRSQAWVNDIPVALPSLKTLGGMLLDVFAQHENQRLLNPHDHIDYVDSFLDAPALRESVRDLGKKCSESVSALSQLLRTCEEKQRQSDYLVFRLEALQKFDPTQADYEKVQAYCGRAEKARKTLEPIQKAFSLLEGEEGNESPAQIAREAAKSLSSLGGAEGQLGERVLQSARELDDVCFELGRLLSKMEVDESELEASQDRLFGYQDLFRKAAVRDIEALLAQQASLSAELALVQNAEEQLERILQGLLQSTKELSKACEKLSVARGQAASVIKENVENELGDLHMPGSVFQAEFTPVLRECPKLDWAAFDPKLASQWEKIATVLSKVSSQGAETAQFFLSANPGEPPLPLAKVASGGELSRIMLALKKALAADAETCVLVFDEIDSGISGRVADVVGRKMRELATGFQVLCISHLPQVAVYADAHFLVTKTGKGERTQSSIIPLSKQESAQEIARLLSGQEVSESSLENAMTLIGAAQSKKKSKKKPSPRAGV
jgi:DNA repair protein RecN (Recombination protein N)